MKGGLMLFENEDRRVDIKVSANSLNFRDTHLDAEMSVNISKQDNGDIAIWLKNSCHSGNGIAVTLPPNLVLEVAQMLTLKASSQPDPQLKSTLR